MSEVRECRSCEYQTREEDQYPCKYCFAEDDHPKWKANISKPKYDAKFRAFQEISKVVDRLVPTGYQLTKEQADAIHACARKLADDLTSGDYV